MLVRSFRLLSHPMCICQEPPLEIDARVNLRPRRGPILRARFFQFLLSVPVEDTVSMIIIYIYIVVACVRARVPFVRCRL